MSSTQSTIRSGERVSTSLAALQSKSAKTYFHAIPGARFVMPDGLEVIFMGGRFTTDDKDLIAELDKVAGRPTSMISTEASVSAAAANLLKTVADSAAATAGQQAETK